MFYELSIINFIQTFRSPFLDKIMETVTIFGAWRTMLPVVILIVLYFFWKKRASYAVALAVSTGLGELIVLILKNLIQRPRPNIANVLITANDFSFPSGHSFVAVSFYGLMAYFLFRLSKTKLQKIASVGLGILVILSIGFSRIYLGAHWPTDVLGSYVIAGALVAVIISFLERKRMSDVSKFP
ncbi:MAG: phosphatase PAP2 family protein [bacterium]|nr:phosphatase PAP2 family protein [bacterium]